MTNAEQPEHPIVTELRRRNTDTTKATVTRRRNFARRELAQAINVVLAAGYGVDMAYPEADLDAVYEALKS